MILIFAIDGALPHTDTGSGDTARVRDVESPNMTSFASWEATLARGVTVTVSYILVVDGVVTVVVSRDDRASGEMKAKNSVTVTYHNVMVGPMMQRWMMMVNQGQSTVTSVIPLRTEDAI